MKKLMHSLKKIFRIFVPFVVCALFLLIVVPCALYVKASSSFIRRKPRLVWGSTPIINNVYWSRAMVKAGFDSETFTSDFFGTINKRSDWDRILSEEHPLVPFVIKPYAGFLRGIFCYDVFFMPFSGFFLGSTPLRHVQAQILKLANKRLVVLAYGSDSYVYRRIRSTSTVHGLMMSYPLASKEQALIAKDVDYWSHYADAVLPGVMGPDGC